MAFDIDTSRFANFFDAGTANILGTAGLVFISYVGVTKVASIAEEIDNPQRNLPLGIFLGLGTAVVIYLVGLTVIVGVTPADELADSLTPVGDAARSFAGTAGLVLVTIAALFAFMSVANAGIMSSSRYPLAMSRDHLIPSVFRTINGNGVPTVSLAVTVLAVVFCIVFFDVLVIAKLASAFQLVLFALVCFAVIVMRESNIDSYDPSFRTPLYPWMPLAGILGPCWLITEMGTAPSLFAVGLVVLGVIWFFAYANKRIDRGGAIFHVFERLGQRRFEGLDQELRGILKERGLRDSDPFDEIIATSEVMEARADSDFESMTRQASDRFARLIDMPSTALVRSFLDGTRVGATPVTNGVALPHLRVGEIDRPYLVIVRSRAGIDLTGLIWKELLVIRNSPFTPSSIWSALRRIQLGTSACLPSLLPVSSRMASCRIGLRPEVTRRFVRCFSGMSGICPLRSRLTAPKGSSSVSRSGNWASHRAAWWRSSAVEPEPSFLGPT